MARANRSYSNMVFYLTALLTLLCISHETYAVEVTTQLSPDTFSTGQSARLTITVTDVQSAQIDIPKIDGLEFIEKGTSKQFQMINGKTSSAVTYTYSVQGITPGSYTIDAITVIAGKETIRTEKLSCTVTNRSSSGGLPQKSPATGATLSSLDLENLVFIKMIPEKTSGYVGEVIPATIEAYFYQGTRANLNSLPILQGDGVLIDTLSNEPAQERKTINNIPFNVITWKTALTGIKEGMHEIVIKMDATIQTRSKQKKRPGFNDRFFQDPFFDDFFTQYETQPVRASSKPVLININNLPDEGKPEYFSGAIGTFTLDFHATPTTVTPGDPITLRMIIEGSGNFDNVTVPTLTSLEGIKSYTPNAEFQPGSLPHSGTKTFEQAIVITDSETKQIPPVVFSYFDPVQKQYRTLSSDPVKIISKSVQQPIIQNPAQKEATVESSTVDTPTRSERFPNLAPVKLSAGSSVSQILPFFRQPLFISAMIFLIVLIAALSGYRLRKNHLIRNPEIVRTRKIETHRRKLHQQLLTIESLKEKDYLEAAQMEIRKMLALLWRVEAASLTTSDISAKLGPDHPITRLFVYTDRSSYGSLAFSQPEKEALHNSILKSIETIS